MYSYQEKSKSIHLKFKVPSTAIVCCHFQCLGGKYALKIYCKLHFIANWTSAVLDNPVEDIGSTLEKKRKSYYPGNR